MTLGRLNHVGIATPSIAQSIETYRTLLGATVIGEPFDLPAQGVKVCFIDTPSTQIELIEPYDDSSPIAGFLKKNPAGGQHHVCFEVPDIHAAVADLKAKGATVLGEPRIGAHGTPIVFVHPKNMGGVLVELMETAYRPMCVSLRALRPTRTAVWKSRERTGLCVPAVVAAVKALRTCPRISDSPSTIDSMLEATRKRWRAASRSVK